MSPTTPTVRDAIREHDFGLMAGVFTLKLQGSRFEIDRAGSVVAWEMANQHNHIWRALTGQTKGDA